MLIRNGKSSQVKSRKETKSALLFHCCWFELPSLDKNNSNVFISSICKWQQNLAEFGKLMLILPSANIEQTRNEQIKTNAIMRFTAALECCNVAVATFTYLQCALAKVIFPFPPFSIFNFLSFSTQISFLTCS